MTDYPPQPVSVVNTGDRSLGIGIDQTNWLLSIPRDPLAGGGTFSFTPMHATAAGDREIIARTSLQRDSLSVLNSIFPGEQPSDPAFRFTYVSYAFANENLGGLSQQSPIRYDAHLFGYPTALAEVPNVGSRTYASIFRSFVYTVTGPAPAKRGSEETTFTVANLAVNFAARMVTFTVVVDFRRDPTGPAVSTTFNGSGTISSDGSLINGTIASSDQIYSGNFTGSFYGPSAAEIGLVFGVGGTPAAGAAQRQQRVIGLVVGK